MHQTKVALRPITPIHAFWKQRRGQPPRRATNGRHFRGSVLTIGRMSSARHGAGPSTRKTSKSGEKAEQFGPLSSIEENHFSRRHTCGVSALYVHTHTQTHTDTPCTADDRSWLLLLCKEETKKNHQIPQHHLTVFLRSWSFLTSRTQHDSPAISAFKYRQQHPSVVSSRLSGKSWW